MAGKYLYSKEENETYCRDLLDLVKDAANSKDHYKDVLTIIAIYESCKVFILGDCIQYAGYSKDSFNESWYVEVKLYLRNIAHTKITNQYIGEVNCNQAFRDAYVYLGALREVRNSIAHLNVKLSDKILFGTKIRSIQSKFKDNYKTILSCNRNIDTKVADELIVQCCKWMSYVVDSNCPVKVVG